MIIPTVLFSLLFSPQKNLADPGLYARDPAAFERAAAALDAVTADLAAAEEEWLALELLQDELNRA